MPTLIYSSNPLLSVTYAIQCSFECARLLCDVQRISIHIWILSQLLQVTAKDKRGKPKSLTVLLDTGSDCSYVRQEVINLFHRVVLVLSL